MALTQYMVTVDNGHGGGTAAYGMSYTAPIYSIAEALRIARHPRNRELSPVIYRRDGALGEWTAVRATEDGTGLYVVSPDYVDSEPLDYSDETDLSVADMGATDDTARAEREAWRIAYRAEHDTPASDGQVGTQTLEVALSSYSDAPVLATLADNARHAAHPVDEVAEWVATVARGAARYSRKGA